MFSKSKEVKKEQAQVAGGSQRNVLAAGTLITGEIKSDGDFRVDGTIEGTIEIKGRIVIGQTGKIDGTMICTNAEVEGSLSGTVHVNDLLSLKQTAKITGDVTVGKLAIEPGATFDATCTMKGSVKNINEGSATKKEKAV
ncbi:MAG: polymer-forming cytoskeletal protein [Flavobacteriales bacterium]|nr:polymer-forming cytoskeletal protein [Flavobacteriales bacterium]